MFRPAEKALLALTGPTTGCDPVLALMLWPCSRPAVVTLFSPCCCDPVLALLLWPCSRPAVVTLFSPCCCDPVLSLMLWPCSHPAVVTLLLLPSVQLLVVWCTEEMPDPAEKQHWGSATTRGGWGGRRRCPHPSGKEDGCWGRLGLSRLSNWRTACFFPFPLPLPHRGVRLLLHHPLPCAACLPAHVEPHFPTGRWGRGAEEPSGTFSVCAAVLVSTFVAVCVLCLVSFCLCVFDGSVMSSMYTSVFMSQEIGFKV